MQNILKTLLLILSTFIISSCSEEVDSDFDLDTNLISQLDKNLYSDEESISKFIIPSNTSSTFTTTYGKLFMFQPNTFLYEDGSIVNESINFEVREYESVSAIVLAGLQTYSSKGVLETEGMFYTKATVPSGKKIKINTNSPLEMGDKLDLNTGEKPYSIYEGEVTNGQLSWRNPKPPSHWGPIPYDAFLNYYYENWVHGKSHEDSILTHFINAVDLLKHQSTWAATPEYMMRAHHLRFSWFMEYVPTKHKEDSMRNYLLDLTSLPLEKADQMILNKRLIDSVDFWKYHFYYGQNKKVIKLKNDSISHAAINNYKTKFLNSYYWLNNEIDFVIDTFSIQFIKKKGYFSPEYTDYPEERKAERNRIRAFYYPICDLRNIHPISLGLVSPTKFTIARLGWQNIDRLVEDDLIEQSLTVTCTNEKEVTFYLILNNNSIMLNKISEDGRCEFHEKIPTGQAKIIAINVKKKAINIGYQNIEIGTDKNIELQLKIVSPDEFYNIISTTVD